MRNKVSDKEIRVQNIFRSNYVASSIVWFGNGNKNSKEREVTSTYLVTDAIVATEGLQKKAE